MDWEAIIATTFMIILLIAMIGAIVIVWFEEITSPFKKLFKKKPKKSKYKMHQRVRVIHDLKHGEDYGDVRVYHRMMKHVGSVVTIDAISEDKQRYYIKEDYSQEVWHWSMFEEVSYTPDQAFEALLHGHISDEEYEEIRKQKVSDSMDKTMQKYKPMFHKLKKRRERG